MKNEEKVIEDRIIKIESNNLKVIEYFSHHSVKCLCNTCHHVISDNYRNLSYSKFKCRYCALISKSKLIQDGIVSVIKIDDHGDGAFIYLKCLNGHEYKQDRRNFLANKKCNRCYLDGKVFSLDKISSEFRKIHGESYTYDWSNYKNLHSEIEIKCRRNHTFFQKVSNHLQGKGCPMCRESVGERVISRYLDDNCLNYVRQKKFKDCKYVSHLPFDFFLPDLNILIEFDGIQHYKPISQFGGEDEFKKTKIKDGIKNKYCLDNKINLIRISYQDNIEDRLRSIKEHIVFQS